MRDGLSSGPPLRRLLRLLSSFLLRARLRHLLRHLLRALLRRRRRRGGWRSGPKELRRQFRNVSRRVTLRPPDLLLLGQTGGVLQMLDLGEQQRRRRSIWVERARWSLSDFDGRHSENSGASVRIVLSVSRSRNVAAAASRGERWVLSKFGSSHLLAVAGMQACSNTRPSSTTVPFATHGDT